MSNWRIYLNSALTFYSEVRIFKLDTYIEMSPEVKIAQIIQGFLSNPDLKKHGCIIYKD